ncbi:MAG: recombinase family protein, partial [Candidatus Pacebacteria bacterium]|nr:recombinase family protein [Candidatus Paceibacterota bacterium]
MKAVILARVSTEEQKEAGNSIPAQQNRLRAYIEKNTELHLIKEFVFDESAYKEHRKEFGKVLDYINNQKEIIALCCDKVDRLSRDFLIGLPALESLRRKGKIELHFPSDNLILTENSPATDLFHFNIALSLAQYYSDAISDNVKRGNEQKRRNGEWLGQTRLGYLNIPLDNGKKDVIIDPERGALIKKMFEMYATGNYSMESLRIKITEMGLKSRKGNKISKGSIYNILKDSFFCGIAISQKHGTYHHKYPKLISKELFDECQAIRQKSHKMPSKKLSKEFLFKGLLRCQDCGCMMTPELKIKPSGKVYILYSCTNAKKICKREYVNEKDLLVPVYEVLDKFETISEETQNKLVEDLRKETESEIAFHKTQVNRIRNEYEKIKKMDDNLLNMFLDPDNDSITKNIYDNKHQEYQSRLQRLNIELEEYTNADYEYQTTVATVISVARRAKTIFENSSDIAGKRAFLNCLLQNPTVKDKKLYFSIASPFNSVLELADSSNWL